MAIKYNLPGNRQYDVEEPFDSVNLSRIDQTLRGYWLARDLEGQLCFVSNQNEADHVRNSFDTDGTPIIIYDDVLTTELSYDGTWLSLRRYT